MPVRPTPRPKLRRRAALPRVPSRPLVRWTTTAAEETKGLRSSPVIMYFVYARCVAQNKQASWRCRRQASQNFHQTSPKTSIDDMRCVPWKEQWRPLQQRLGKNTPLPLHESTKYALSCTHTGSLYDSTWFFGAWMSLFSAKYNSKLTSTAVDMA